MYRRHRAAISPSRHGEGKAAETDVVSIVPQIPTKMPEVRELSEALPEMSMDPITGVGVVASRNRAPTGYDVVSVWTPLKPVAQSTKTWSLIYCRLAQQMYLHTHTLITDESENFDFPFDRRKPIASDFRSYYTYAKWLLAQCYRCIKVGFPRPGTMTFSFLALNYI